MTESATWSSDGTRVAFIRQNDTWERCTDTGLPIRAGGGLDLWLSVRGDPVATPITSFTTTESPWAAPALAWMPGS